MRHPDVYAIVIRCSLKKYRCVFRISQVPACAGYICALYRLRSTIVFIICRMCKNYAMSRFVAKTVNKTLEMINF